MRTTSVCPQPLTPEEHTLTEYTMPDGIRICGAQIKSSDGRCYKHRRTNYR